MHIFSVQNGSYAYKCFSGEKTFWSAGQIGG